MQTGTSTIPGEQIAAVNQTKKTTLTDLLAAYTNQANRLIANSTDDLIDFTNPNPPRIGDYWPGQGGVYAGIVRDGNRQWHLILADQQHTIEAEWGTYPNQIPGDFSRRDGQHNTALILAAEPENTIATHCTALLIDGHKDFYWPAQCENNLLFTNLPEQLTPDWHWSSTQSSAHHAWLQVFEDGTQYIDIKGNSLAARAVRRILIIQ